MYFLVCENVHSNLKLFLDPEASVPMIVYTNVSFQRQHVHDIYGYYSFCHLIFKSICFAKFVIAITKELFHLFLLQILLHLPVFFS